MSKRIHRYVGRISRIYRIVNPRFETSYERQFDSKDLDHLLTRRVLDVISRRSYEQRTENEQRLLAARKGERGIFTQHSAIPGFQGVAPCNFGKIRK